MSTKSEGEAHLRHMDIKVKDMCDDLDPVYIIKYPGSAPFMQSELCDISSVLYKYKSDLRAFLLVYNSELTEQEVVLWEKGLQNTEEVVKAHKLSFEATVNQVMPHSMHMLGPMTCYETEMIKLKEQSLKLKEEAIFSCMRHFQHITSTQPVHPIVSDSAWRSEMVHTTPAVDEQIDSVPNLDEQVTSVLAPDKQVALQAIAQPPGHQQGCVLGEPQHLGVLTVNHQDVPQPPGHAQGCVLSELISDVMVTNKDVLDPGHPEGCAQAEPQLLGVKAVINQAL